MRVDLNKEIMTLDDKPFMTGEVKNVEKLDENGTAPSAHTDNGTYIYSQDCGTEGSAGNLASLALYTEEPVLASVKTPPHALPVIINGQEFWALLTQRWVD